MACIMLFEFGMHLISYVDSLLKLCFFAVARQSYSIGQGIL